MNGKRMLSLVLTLILAVGLYSMPAMASSRKKITEVKMTVTANIVPGGSIADQQAEIEVINSKVGLGDCQFINDGFSWCDGDVPRLEIKLYADEGYYFSTSQNGFDITGGTFVKQKREDLSRTITVTIDLPPVASGQTEGEWKLSETGWWYQYKDGGFPSDSWQYIGGHWYFFDQQGYMQTGWIDWKEKQYYCDTTSGQLLVDTTTPDGKQVGSDGAKLP